MAAAAARSGFASEAVPITGDGDLRTVERIRQNLAEIRGRIRKAADRSGRDAAQVRVVAVTKAASLPLVRALLATGHRDLGENRPQQLLQRVGDLAGEPASSSLRWHLIGQLQRNKVRSLLPRASLIHSVDSLRLLERIDQLAGAGHLRPRVLLQVNVSGEGSKSGFAADELRAAWDEAVGRQHLEIAGLMTMAPLTEDEATIRSTFAGLRRLRDELQERRPELPLPELSMGMSGDFECAVECGATIVRLGSAVFAGCPVDAPTG